MRIATWTFVRLQQTLNNPRCRLDDVRYLRDILAASHGHIRFTSASAHIKQFDFGANLLYDSY